MPSQNTTAPLWLSQRTGRTAFLILCALIPLAMHTGIYNYALLPKRFILLLGLAAVAFVLALDIRAKRATLFHTPFYIPLFAYISLMLISLSQAENPVAGLVAIGHQISLACLFILVLHAFPISSLPTFLRISAIVGILVSILGIAEARGIDAAWLPLSNGRPSATFAYRNFAAAFLIMNLPLSILLWLRAKNTQDAYLGIVSTAMMFVFLIYTRTRGAWVGLACAIIIAVAMAIFARWRWQTQLAITRTVQKNRALAIAAVLAFCLAGWLSYLPPRIASQQARAIDEKKVDLLDALSFAKTPEADRGRMVMWRHTLSMIGDHPLLGVGPGNWQFIYPSYDRGDMLRADSAPERPHNEWLWIASESGIPSLLAFLCLLLILAHTVWKILKTNTDPDTTAYTLAFSIGLLAMLGHGMVSFPSERIAPSWLFWFGLGLLAQTALSHRRSTLSHIRSQWVAWGIFAVVLLNVVLTYRHIQFDRHYLNAFSAHAGGDQPTALRETTAALRWGPFNPQVFLLQGNAYQAAGLLPRAEGAYQMGLHYAPNSVQLMKALGTACAMQRKFEQAENQYRAALKIYPKYNQIHNDLGNIHYQQGAFLKAIAAYRLAASKLGDATDTQRNLALAYVAADSLPQAIRIYNRLIMQTPDDVVLYYELGEAYLKQGKREPGVLAYARASFERFLKLWRGPKQYADQARQYLITIKQKRDNAQP